RIIWWVDNRGGILPDGINRPSPGELRCGEIGHDGDAGRLQAHGRCYHVVGEASCVGHPWVDLHEELERFHCSDGLVVVRKRRDWVSGAADQRSCLPVALEEDLVAQRGGRHTGCRVREVANT